MLQAIRNRTGSWIVKGLFVFLLLSFAAWGVEGYIHEARQGRAHIEIGDRSIDEQSFLQQVDGQLAQFRQVLGTDRAQLKQLGFVDRAIDGVIDQYRLEEEARRLGIRISDDLVRESILRIPGFTDANGKFDRARLDAALARAGYSEARFVEEQRRTMAIAQLADAVVGVAHVPGVLADRLAAYRGERRVFDVLALGPDTVPAPASPTDQQIEAHYKAHPQSYTAPELRKLSVLAVTPDAIAATVTVSDADVAAAYEARKTDFDQPERRALKQLRFDTETEAKAAAADLAKGTAFVDVAKAAKIAPDETDLGLVAKAELPPALADAAFALAAGATSAPIETGLGWYVLRVERIEPAHVRTLDEVKASLAETLKREKSADRVYEIANKLDEQIDRKATLEAMASQYALQVTTIAAIDAQGFDGARREVADLPAPTATLPAAFALKSGETGHMLEDRAATAFYAVRVDAVTPPMLRPLDAVRAEVVADWTEARRREALKAKADAIAESARKGTALKDLALRDKLTVTSSAPLTRDAQGSAVPPAALGDLFRASPGGVAVAENGADGYAVVVLTKIEPAGEADVQNARATIKGEVDRQIANDLAQAFTRSLAERYPFKGDRAVIASRL